MHLVITFFSVFLLLTNVSHAQEAADTNVDAPKPSHEAAHADDLKIINLSDTLAVIQGSGGNIAFLHGDNEEGGLVVDSGLAEHNDKVLAAIRKISDKPVRFLMNTHWHYDHVGTNLSFGQGSTVILAREEVRKRMERGGTIEAFDKRIRPVGNRDALPFLTYDAGITLRMNNEKVKIRVVENAHTDGDSYVYFNDHDVIHTGDLFFNGFWPFIDVSSGGSLPGMINAAKEIYERAQKDTKIIPGHGPIATKTDFLEYQLMLLEVLDRIKKARREGMTKEKWVASKPLADFDAKWGGGFLSTDKFTEIAWDAVKEPKG